VEKHCSSTYQRRSTLIQLVAVLPIYFPNHPLPD
jgi:hypothetical protein